MISRDERPHEPGYTISIRIEIAPKDLRDRYQTYRQGLTMTYTGDLSIDGSVHDAAEIAAQFEALAKKIIAADSTSTADSRAPQPESGNP
jgi:hypothetical protein